MGVKVREHRGAWWLFVNHGGRRKAKRVGEGRSGKKAAEAAAVKIGAALASGTGLEILNDKPRVPTFAQYAEAWLTGVVAVRCQASTCELYRNHLKVWLTPAFGALPLDHITRERIRAFIAQMHAAELAVTTIRRITSLLAAILNTAVDDGVIAGNPAARLGRVVNARRDEAEEVDVFTADELARLLTAVTADAEEQQSDRADHRGAWLHPFVLTLARTGMRIGEAAGLEWGDVDLERRQITVRRTATRRGTSVPKSGKARRCDVSRQLAETLASWQSLQAAEAAVAGREPVRVFESPGGAPVGVADFRRRAWRRGLTRARLAYRRPHVLRHTFASLLIQAGEPPTYVARQLGHHSPAFTLRVYGHFVPQGERRAVDALDHLASASVRNLGATAAVGG